MRALRFHSYGTPQVLRLDDVPLPSPGPGEVRVRVLAAGINFADTERRRGLYGTDAPLPYSLGLEGAGVVDTVGPGVDLAWPGRRVTWLGAASQAEWTVVPVDAVQEIPPGVDFVTAAALPVQGLTAWHLLHTVGRLRAGARVLVHSAAGGTGTLLVQLARAGGAEVLGVVGSEAKAALPRRLGARDVFAGAVGGGALSAWVREATGGRGVDLVLDAVGHDTFAESLASLAPFGHLVLYGSASGKAPAVDPEALFSRSLTLTSYWLRAPHSPGAHAEALGQLLGAVEAGGLSPQIGEALPFGLEEARAAHGRIEGRGTSGKLVLTLT